MSEHLRERQRFGDRVDWIPMETFEVNFDGLVGPTHNYSGLSTGNLASMGNAALASNPREAALQGLKKMAVLRGMGLRQAVLPPQERPSLEFFRSLGFSGNDNRVIEQIAKQAPLLFYSGCSASPMWTANAATVAPSSDTTDHKVHFTPANLVSKLHRSIEAHATERALKTIFRDPKRFQVHAPLPATDGLGDEGAANHTRLAPKHSDKGLHLFVYGRTHSVQADARPTRFPARQTREASQSVARLSGLPDTQTVFAQQNPEAIDAGVFHNDVISVGNGDVFFYHERCFADSDAALEDMQSKWAALGHGDLRLIRVSEDEVPLEDAVKSYLFNSQLITLPSNKMVLIAPSECETTASVKKYLEAQMESGEFLSDVHYPQLRQSMRNGGGPACLRLRVVLNEEEIKLCAPGVFLDDKKQKELENWVVKHYREKLEPADLADPKLLEESRTALDTLTQILGLGSLYPFQYP